MEPGKSRPPFVIVILLVFVAAALYVGSFLALAKPLQGADGQRFFVYPAADRSRWAEGWLHAIFSPLEWLDQHFRPESWLPPRP